MLNCIILEFRNEFDAIKNSFDELFAVVFDFDRMLLLLLVSSFLLLMMIMAKKAEHIFQIHELLHVQPDPDQNEM